MSTNIFVEAVAHAAIFAVARIPFRHHIAEVFPNEFLHYLLALLAFFAQILCSITGRREVHRTRFGLCLPCWPGHHVRLWRRRHNFYRRRRRRRIAIRRLAAIQPLVHRLHLVSIHAREITVAGHILVDIINNMPSQLRNIVAHRNPVKVWISILAVLVAHHGKKPVSLTVGDDGRHHNLCRQFCPVCYDSGSDIRRITDEIITHLSHGGVMGKQSLWCINGFSVQSVNVVSLIIRTIQRKPFGRNATKTYTIFHLGVGSQKPMTRIIARNPLSMLHPWRSPGQVLDSTIQFFLLVSEMHRRRAHVLTNSH